MYSKWTICTVHVQSVQSMNNMHVTLTIFKVHEQSVQYMNNLYSTWTICTVHEPSNTCNTTESQDTTYLYKRKTILCKVLVLWCFLNSKVASFKSMCGISQPPLPLPPYWSQSIKKISKISTYVQNLFNWTMASFAMYKTAFFRPPLYRYEDVYTNCICILNYKSFKKTSILL